MNEAQVRTLEQVRQVLAGTQAMEFQAAADDAGRYAWIAADAGIGGHRRRSRPAVARQRAPLLHRQLPFARTASDRLASGDSRLSLEERHGNRAGYVEAVQRAAARAVREGLLLEADAAALVSAARASRVLK